MFHHFLLHLSFFFRLFILKLYKYFPNKYFLYYIIFYHYTKFIKEKRSLSRFKHTFAAKRISVIKTKEPLRLY